MSVLVINSGSSSIKYKLVDTETETAIAHGLVEQIGGPNGRIVHHFAGENTELKTPIPDHEVGLRRILELFDEVGPDLQRSHVRAVGHRVVQGGRYFSSAALVDDEVLELIAELIPLGPLHNPANLKGIQVAMELLDVPHVAVFDTAFFHSLPNEAAIYPLNREVAEKYQIRRYGAHGTSHQFVSRKVAELMGRDDLRQIVLHLGNGASASAVVNGRAIDTSMGLTPLEGLMMGTRTGDIDPAVVFHLVREAGMTIDEIDNLFNKESGMKGLSGDSDMRPVWDRADAGDKNALEAIDVYVHRVVSYIGAYTAQMGGLDVLTFTAGIGERDIPMRQLICERLAPFGVRLDYAANQVKPKEPCVISLPESSVRVMVVPTNEELEIAKQAIELVQNKLHGNEELPELGTPEN
ncbi:MAG: acetate kinase [Trueperella sp.]|nr:acetate kinase [Trueperella sp.]